MLHHYGLESSDRDGFKVNRSNVASAKATGWQKKSWEWAKAGVAFKVRGIIATNHPFIRELCAAYNCTYRFSDRKLVVTVEPVDRNGFAG